MTPLEKDIERKLRKMVERHGGLCLKWVCPGWAGVPDRLVLLPGGNILFCELKRPQGSKVAELQEFWRRRLLRLGFDVWHVYNDDHVHALDLLIQDLTIKRSKTP